MNVLTITGNLGRDAKVSTVSGTSVANFSVAAKAGYGDREQTIWVDCALWGQRAEGKLVDYLNKGQMVCVSGEMGTREHDGKTYITMRVDKLTLCGGRDDSRPQSNNQPTQQRPAQNQYAQQTGSGGMDMGDDIPFICLGHGAGWRCI